MDNTNKKKIFGIIIFIVMLLAIPAVIFLVKQQQTLKSKATETRLNAFELKDANGNPINCDSSTTPPTCTTNTLDFSVRVKDLNPLLGQ